MNYKITALAVMTVIVGLISSCVSDDSSSATYDDVLITSFTLGNVKCTKHITKSNGKDSTYTYSYAASAYPMSIDQIHDSIFNTYPLVVYTNVSKVLTSISTKNNGTVYVQEKDSTGIWYYFSTSDSLDYTKDRKFRVFSSNGQNYRDYTVHVNIAEYEENAGTWGTADSCYVDEPYLYTNISSCVFNGNQICLILTRQGGAPLICTSNTYGHDWEVKTFPTGATNADTVVVAANNKLYMLLANGGLWQSDDNADNWTATGTTMPLKNLVGGDSLCLHAIGQNDKFVSLWNSDTESELEFTTDSLENEKYYNVTKSLPYKDITFLTLTAKTNYDLDRYFVVANPNPAVSGNDTTAVIWSHVEDLDDIRERMPWCLTAFNAFNLDGALPSMTGLTAACFNEYILAMGGKSNHRLSKSVTPFSKLYYSPDWGATWHTDTNFVLPSDYSTTNLCAVKLLATSDFSFRDGETKGGTCYLLALYNEPGKTKSKLKVWKATLYKTDSSKYYFE